MYQYQYPDYDNKPIFLWNDKPNKLIDEFIQTILKISLKAKSINQIKYANIIEFQMHMLVIFKMIMIDSKNGMVLLILMMINN